MHIFDKRKNVKEVFLTDLAEAFETRKSDIKGFLCYSDTKSILRSSYFGNFSYEVYSYKQINYLCI